MSTTVSRRWEPKNPEYEQVVRAAFARQSAMALIGATLDLVEPGRVDIGLPCHEQIMSHIPPVVHGGTIGMIADSAMGFAALTLSPAERGGVTAEYKINMLSPAIGDKLVARGTVLRAGSKLTIAQAEIFVFGNDGEKRVAMALGTLIPL
ncbi:PaaI family thioesterase [Spirillospora sp. NPDC047279]|uniref:PaaI family thioesterase n=1 Tax=Spirillospora sp. NPDC047279 TaxID=3155478 RepID=UPI0033EBF202